MLRLFLLLVALPVVVIAECAPKYYDPCPSGYYWLQETDSCYKAVVGFLTVQQADGLCRWEGSQLASIHSKVENDFLVDLSKIGVSVSDPSFNNGLFIGLSYENNAWRWSDGSPLDYKNWANGEPNNMGFEWWAAILPDPGRSDYNPTGGQWNNIDKQQRGYICKRKAF